MRDFLRELLEASSGSRLQRYATVVAAIVVATLLRWLLDPYLGNSNPFVTYICALVFTAWCYGVVPSLLTIALGLIAATYFFIPPRHSLLIFDVQYWAGSGKHVVNAFGYLIPFAVLGAAYRHAAATALKAFAKQRQLEKEIAQRKQAEEALRQAHDELEQRVQERTSALARANEALQEADRRKDEFLAMLAHELRNPLAPIRNGLYILRMPKADGAAGGRVIQMMEQQVRHLTRMVDDLLDVSRISRGKIQLCKETIDLASAVGHAVETVRPLAEAQRHTLSVVLPPEPIFLEGDATRLEQVLCNLLNNAAKYTEPGGRIDLTVQRDGDAAVVGVRDTGVGIPADMLPHVFDLFTQADRSLARSQGGLGIGLTLVRKLVEMMGGTVTAHSDGLGKGSQFLVRLPTLPQPVRPAQGSPITDARPRGRALRVLVVEDVGDVADMLVMLLTLWGHEVRSVPDGHAALLAARTYHPDVVLLDIGLPGMNGYDVARQLRQEANVGRPVIAAVTGYGGPEDRRRSREAGFDHHLIKPVVPAALEAILACAESCRQETTPRLALQAPPEPTNGAGAG
jgi:signal transduction histidine kinase/ActR/RegA family two-component response regulator